jgi:hypothetical protein
VTSQRKPKKSDIPRQGDREYHRAVFGVLKAMVMILERRDDKENTEEHLRAIIYQAEGWLREMAA